MQISKKLTIGVVVGVAMLAVACQNAGTASEPGLQDTAALAAPAVAAAAPTPIPTAVPPTPFPAPEPAAEPASAPTPADAATPTPLPMARTQTPTATPFPTDDVPARLVRNWATDFTKHSVAYSEIISGGPPRDGIPPIDEPLFHDVSDPPDYMVDNAPVLSLEINGEAKAYPLAIMIWHEIVNDEIGGVPVSITYCPLCNTAIVFDRRVDGTVLDFGTSGNLRNSDLVMWDRQTESWWQQITGEAIVGELTGTKLEFIPASLVSWSAFAENHPDGQVQSRITGFNRDYAGAPYGGYDTIGNRPFLFSGQIDDRLDAMERVVGLTVDGHTVAYPFPIFEKTAVVNDTVGLQNLVIFYASDTLSAFRGRGYSESRVIGSTGVFDPNLDGQKLTFRQDGPSIVDDQTGSSWTVLGQAVEGPLSGKSLTPVVHANHFWFAWAVFFPETELRSGDAISG
ncbi:MAG TPA: hypothetical protein DCP37_15500 [Dehalococcoidia bacterium]|nr:DUF3179 domain-containing protein [SAR202 cluster bacterium]MDP6663871.1 DUF3179 domain-containing protein [SAR202 cluster bacterium]MDP6799646.1 DUF3179 domain-containing protein [SAR202 cluster bacterium]MQG57633.1 DUF3179 domain-containing protein [SAR202 cluster bacterium]HAL49154.1 hypothetical protein [Dehalococcoidia bacterium]